MLETITDEAELEEPNDTSGKTPILIEPGKSAETPTQLVNIAEQSEEQSMIHIDTRPNNPLLQDLITDTTQSHTSTKNFLMNELEAMAVPNASSVISSDLNPEINETSN